MDACWHRIEAQYAGRQTTCRVGALSLNLFTNPDRPHQAYPLLSSNVEAAECRHLVPIIADLCDDVCDMGIEEDFHMAGAVKALARVYDAMDCDEDQLPPAHLLEFRASMRDLLLHYRWLHHNALHARPRQMLWNEVPKHHYSAHVADQAGLQNPRRAWCYPDEDFMGAIKTIAQSCLAGTRAHRAMRKVIQKWAFGIGLRLYRPRVG